MLLFAGELRDNNVFNLAKRKVLMAEEILEKVEVGQYETRVLHRDLFVAVATTPGKRSKDIVLEARLIMKSRPVHSWDRKYGYYFAAYFGKIRVTGLRRIKDEEGVPYKTAYNEVVKTIRKNGCYAEMTAKGTIRHVKFV
jgi:hypothetical protein